MEKEKADRASWPQARFGLRRNVPVTIFPGNFSDYTKWDDHNSTNPDEEIKADPDFLEVGNQKQITEDDLIREIIKKQDEKEAAQRAKWIQNYKTPKVFTTKISSSGQSYARGARKTSSARVWIQPGLGEITVNRQDYAEYFVRETHREHILEPFILTETLGHFDVTVTVRGGGHTGQAGAIRYGLANALQKYNPELYRPVLRYKGLLTRDARRVERKKIGKVKSRKSPTWVKR